ncbi:MAG: FecR domain-containing protein [SAR324 cluster bacterium]|nr:FecR domain-containing protein [SAR324 cluster bacterium]
MKKMIVVLACVLLYGSSSLGAEMVVGILIPHQQGSGIYIESQPVTQPTPVTRDVFIRLGSNSTAELAMNNGDRFILVSDTMIRVRDYYDEEGTAEKSSLFEMIRGKVEALIEGRDKEKLLIQTGNAIIGVKGTEFIIETPSSQLTQVTTLSGTVSLQRMDQQQFSKEIFLEAGFRSLIVKKSSPTPPFFISTGDRLEINRLFQRWVRLPGALERLSSDTVVDNAFNQEIKRRVVQQALRNQAALVVDIVF